MTEVTQTFANQYGPYAFGVAAVCVLLTALSVIWNYVFKPTVATLNEISKNNALTTQYIRDTTATLERSLSDTKAMNDNLVSLIDRVNTLEHPVGRK